MRKILLPLLLTALIPGISAANPHGYPSGANIGFGDSTALERLQAKKKNPAAPMADVRRGVSIGIFGLSIGYEFGDLKDMDKKFEEFENNVNDLETKLEDIDAELEDFDEGSLDAVTDLVESGQAVQSPIQEITDELYVGLGVKGSVLPFPLEITSEALRGSLFFDLDFDLRTNLSVLYGIPDSSPFSQLSTDKDDYGFSDGTCGSDDFTSHDFCVDDKGDIYTAPNEQLELMESDGEDILGSPAAYVQAALTRTFSLGYGSAIYQNGNGTLFAGGRLNHFDVELTRVAAGFEDDPMETLQEEMDANRKNSSDFGLDAGVVWASDLYQFGATILNVNAPSFAYTAVPQSCDNNESCQLLNDAIERGDIERSQEYEMETQVSVEGAIQSPGRSWLVSASVDVNPVDGPFGEQFYDSYQWLSAGVAYQPDFALLPGIRFGYRQNMVGSELKYISGGVTLFNLLSLDAAATTEMVESVPRGFMLSAGLELSF